jgi:hypothetical protein
MILGLDNVRQGLGAAGRRCRDVALGLVAGFSHKIGFHEIEARVAALPAREQAAITAAVLAGLFLCSLIAAQFGLIGMALYLLAIVLIVR